MCFVLICEQTATCASYPINWLVFITEMQSVYNAVRTRSLNKAVCASSLNRQNFQARWLLYVPSGLTFKNSTFCPHSVVYGFQNKQRLFPYTAFTDRFL